MTENSASNKTLTVSVAGSEPVVLQLDSTGAATLRLEITVVAPVHKENVAWESNTPGFKAMFVRFIPHTAHD